MTVTTTPTCYSVSALPADNINVHHFTIEVKYRGRGLWAVCWYGMCLGAGGEWDHESIPTERADEWLAGHRFDLETALRLAQEEAPRLTVNGDTVGDVLARAAKRGSATGNGEPK